jgi:hypothetical protein
VALQRRGIAALLGGTDLAEPGRMSPRLVVLLALTLGAGTVGCDASIGGGSPGPGDDDNAGDDGGDDDGLPDDECTIDDDCAGDETCDDGTCVSSTPAEYTKLEDWSMSPLFSVSMAGLQKAGTVLDAGTIYVLDIVNLEDTDTYDFDVAFVSYPQGTDPVSTPDPFADAEGGTHGGAFASPRMKIYDLDKVPAAATCLDGAMCVVDTAKLGEKPAGGNWIHTVTGMAPSDKGVRIVFDWPSPPLPSRDVYLVTR